ncbi:adenosylcobinamide-GDP ribazoletransferase [Pedobacter sp. P351]|uniref:adenosylcobinamide-GDP ribazoletransferase n=1 Tax=Pedobacter superstes TaxID=3133441 RepID=UPI0030A9E364
MKHEWQIFLTALSFYTRIPVKPTGDFQSGYLANSIRYLPVIGWLTGLFSFMVFWCSTKLFSVEIAIMFSMLASVLLTGALHEDGLADVCDGFGGGWTREKILIIMKDSRIGTYGVIGLVFILALKFLALRELVCITSFPRQFDLLILFYLLAHSLSRFSALSMVFTHHYAGLEENKSKQMVMNTGISDLYIALVFTLLPLLLIFILTAQYKWIFILVPLTFVKLYLGRYFNKWIGGYTGDCLGAIQQITELVNYLSLIILWKFF